MSYSKKHEAKMKNSLLEYGKKTRFNAIKTPWMYPLQGAVYFVSHPVLYHAAKVPLLRQLALTSAVTVTMFIFTYLPQVAVLAIFNGPLAFATAVPVVLAESSAVAKIITRFFFDIQQQAALDYIFDETLAQEGDIKLASLGHMPLATTALTSSSPSTGSIALLSKAQNVTVTPPSRKINGLLRYLVSLPLNAIPVIGTLLFAIWNASLTGPDCHRRYFQLLKFSDRKKEEEKKSRSKAYTAFGTTVNLLNIVIPFGSVLTSFTSTVGAALWAVDIEKTREHKTE